MEMLYGIIKGALIVVFTLSLLCSAWAINRITLSQVQASFVGENEGDRLGYSVTLFGDVNGDGYNDILIGAPDNDYNGDDAGQAYLFFGKPNGWQMRTPVSEADASFIGETSVGFSSTTCDVNGDGYDDILIAAPWEDWREKSYVGQTYLIFGKSHSWEMWTNLSQADGSFIGVAEWSISGSVLTSGDVNDDGYDDILINAPGLPPGGSDTPQYIYLFFGKSDGWRMRTRVSQADVSFVGGKSFGGSGWSISVAGDVNGDGYNDILIGSFDSDFYGERTGQTFIFFGKPDGWEREMSLSEADASLVGEGEWNDAGMSVASPGDVNGDGYDDILIGAPLNSDGGKWAGQVYLVFGKSTGWSMWTPLTQADASFIGEGEKDQAGTGALVGAGDINADGYDDFLIGAIGGPSSPFPGADTGRVYLFFGRADGWRMRTPLAEADIAFEGEELGDLTGEFISGKGDVNADGRDDVLIGVSHSNVGGDKAGQAYLVLEIPVTISTSILPDGSLGIPYSAILSATMGTPPYFWSLSSGSLPDGLELDSTGIISGVPNSADTSDCTVQVTDAVSDMNTKTFIIVIRETAKGDVNGDGQINIVDAVFAVNIVLELYDPTPTQQWAADCNGDGAVNILDVIGIVNGILGIGTCQP